MLRKAKWIALACSAIILGVIGYYGYSFYQFGSNIQENVNDPFVGKFQPQTISQKEELAPPKWEGKERVNILLMGADSRGLSKNEVPRSDTIMVASVDPVTKKAHLFSILRDTYVKIPGYGDDRINTALALGGPNLAMKTVSDLLGLPIQYYVYTDFQGFMALVDAMGGIEIDVEKDMKYHDSEEPEFDINLKKGLQHMNGKTALQYVRFRHDALSDFSRTERQRKFMTALADELQTTSSIFRLPSILNKIDPYITTNISISDMLKLGALGFDVKANGVTGQQIPPSGLLKEANIGGASVLTVNKTKLQQFVKAQLEQSANADMYAMDDDDDDASVAVSRLDSGSKTQADSSEGAGRQTDTGTGTRAGAASPAAPSKPAAGTKPSASGTVGTGTPSTGTGGTAGSGATGATAGAGTSGTGGSGTAGGATGTAGTGTATAGGGTAGTGAIGGTTPSAPDGTGSGTTAVGGSVTSGTGTLGGTAGTGSAGGTAGGTTGTGTGSSSGTTTGTGTGSDSGTTAAKPTGSSSTINPITVMPDGT